MRPNPIFKPPSKSRFRFSAGENLQQHNITIFSDYANQDNKRKQNAFQVVQRQIY